jgi:hypothetical protein
MPLEPSIFGYEGGPAAPSGVRTTLTALDHREASTRCGGTPSAVDDSFYRSLADELEVVIAQ